MLGVTEGAMEENTTEEAAYLERGEPKAEEVKFRGYIASYNPTKGFGMIASPEAHAMWAQQIFVYKDVLAPCEAKVGDEVRFGIHVNARGQPQASLPCFKIDQDGSPIGAPEDLGIINAEELAEANPGFLDRLLIKIRRRSDHQNKRRGLTDKGDARGKCKDKGKGKYMSGGDAWGGAGYDSWKGGAKGASNGASAWSGVGNGAEAWEGAKGAWDQGKDAKGGAWEHHAAWDKGADAWGHAGWAGGWDGPGAWITLCVAGVPPGVERREVAHIFRQYEGFTTLRTTDRADATLVFVVFATHALARRAQDALHGYVWDDEAPLAQQRTLSVEIAKQRKRS